MAKDRLYFNGVIGKVFDVEVIKGFMHIKYLKYFFDEASYQRDIDKEHVESIKNFIDDVDKDYKIFPEIVITLPESQYLDDADINIRRSVIKSYGKVLSQIEFKDLGKIKDNSFCQIIDGNHRVKAIVQSEAYQKAIAENENYQVPVSFVNTNEEIEGKAFFYYLNAKSKKLLSKDYFNYLETTEEVDKLKKIDEELYYFKIIYDALKDLDGEDENFSQYVLELSKYLVSIFNCDELKFMIKKDGEHFKKIINFFKTTFEKLNYESVASKINILKLSAYLLSEELSKDKNRYNTPKVIDKEYKNVEEIAEEVGVNKQLEQQNLDNLDSDLKKIEQIFLDFNEWLTTSRLKAEELNSLHAIEVLYKVFKKTYIPKRNKIFLSMPFDRETELTYFIIKDLIRDLKEEEDLDLELVRVDKKIYPTSDYIPQRVYEEINNCGLMIADLTGNNRNVYNEVGYKTALDKDLKEPQIILIHNTDSYYDENAKKYKEEHVKEEKQNCEGEKKTKTSYDLKCKDPKNVEVFEVKVKELKNIDVGFNISAVAQIRFKDDSFLKTKLREQLVEYYTNYKVQRK